MDKKLNLIKSIALCVIAFCMAVESFFPLGRAGATD